MAWLMPARNYSFCRHHIILFIEIYVFLGVNVITELKVVCFFCTFYPFMCNYNFIIILSHYCAIIFLMFEFCVFLFTTIYLKWNWIPCAILIYIMLAYLLVQYKCLSLCPLPALTGTKLKFKAKLEKYICLYVCIKTV